MDNWVLHKVRGVTDKITAKLTALSSAVAGTQTSVDNLDERVTALEAGGGGGSGGGTVKKKSVTFPSWSPLPINDSDYAYAAAASIDISDVAGRDLTPLDVFWATPGTGFTVEHGNYILPTITAFKTSADKSINVEMSVPKTAVSGVTSSNPIMNFCVKSVMVYWVE